MMSIKIDTYSFQARLLPVYLTLSPVILLIIGVIPSGLKIQLGASTAIVFVPISFLLSQVGGDLGKRLEQTLWSEWGGPPTTRFLRHGNDEFNKITRDRIHQKLWYLGLQVPTDDEQNFDQNLADQYYESCVEELRRRTRDKNKYPLVFKGLIEYGFRRNLLGLKPYGIVLCVLSLIGNVFLLYSLWLKDKELSEVLIVTSLIMTGILFSWVFYVTKHAVELASQRYARYLLESALDIEE